MDQNSCLLCVFSVILCFVPMAKCFPPCREVTIKNGSFVKIYYTGEGFYQFYFFDHLPSYNNSLGITTNNYDTIIYKGSVNINDNFDIYKNGSSTKSTNLPGKIHENCVDRKPMENISKTAKYRCDINEETETFGIKSGNLRIIFTCIPLPENDADNDYEEAREDDSEMSPSFVFDIPDRYPSRE